GNVGGVVVDEGGKHPVDFRLGRVAAFRRHGTLDHAAGAAANHRPRGLEGGGGQAFTRQNDVERIDQVGGGVDERAVEIEYGSGHGGGHDRSLAGECPESKVCGCFSARR